MSFECSSFEPVFYAKKLIKIDSISVVRWIGSQNLTITKGIRRLLSYDLKVSGLDLTGWYNFGERVTYIKA